MSFLNFLSDFAVVAVPIPMILAGLSANIAFNERAIKNYDLRNFGLVSHVLVTPGVFLFCSAAVSNNIIKPCPALVGIVAAPFMLSMMIYGADKTFKKYE